MGYKIFTLSPGSTSTKLAVFDGEERIFKANVTHDPETLKSFAKVNDQLPYRVETILAELGKEGISLEEMDAFAAYSGGLESTPGGIFPVNDKIIADCTKPRIFEHPAILGAQIIHRFSQQTGKPALLVNPPDTDEFQDLARVSGIKGIYRESHVHVLNQKEVAMRAPRSWARPTRPAVWWCAMWAAACPSPPSRTAASSTATMCFRARAPWPPTAPATCL